LVWEEKWVCDVSKKGLHTGINKSFSYSIPYTYSNPSPLIHRAGNPNY